MLNEIRRRVKKAGQPPGTLLYTGEHISEPPQLTVINYSENDCQEYKNKSLADSLPEKFDSGVTWVHLEGLQDVELIGQLAAKFALHPLTVEDILNVSQRPKVEEFENYLFITFKMLIWNDKSHDFIANQISMVLGKNIVLSFSEYQTSFFDSIRKRLHGSTSQRLRQQGSDYLFYRLADSVVDQYFVILEKIGDEVEDLEELIMRFPTQKNSHTLYRLKRQMLLLRKLIWPMREVISQLLQTDEKFISQFTHVYLRDLYDHVVQAIDNIETFRDMLSGILDIYLSSITVRTNEIMKVLTIIATIFIPITFVASVYGMNFKYMPELNWVWGYPAALAFMLIISVVMLYFFHKRKWI